MIQLGIVIYVQLPPIKYTLSQVNIDCIIMHGHFDRYLEVRNTGSAKKCVNGLGFHYYIIIYQ